MRRTAKAPGIKVRKFHASLIPRVKTFIRVKKRSFVIIFYLLQISCDTHTRIYIYIYIYIRIQKVKCTYIYVYIKVKVK